MSDKIEIVLKNYGLFDLFVGLIKFTTIGKIAILKILMTCKVLDFDCCNNKKLRVQQ
jgi:hypothetical protein